MEPDEDGVRCVRMPAQPGIAACTPTGARADVLRKLSIERSFVSKSTEQEHQPHLAIPEGRKQPGREERTSRQLRADVIGGADNQSQA
jgi:hypothetical protein